MPSSASESIPYLIEFIRKNQPDLQSVLDVGVGFGKYGFLLREYYDAKEWHRYKPNDWRLKITGVDIYDGYLSELQNTIYDDIIIGDIRDVLPKLGTFDIAILGDVLEHFEKDVGYSVLQSVFDHTQDIVIATPFGFQSHAAESNNLHEEHKSGWKLEDFKNFEVIDQAIVKRIRKHEQVLVVYLRKT